jgi:polysaccharide export outer membrane protein
MIRTYSIRIFTVAMFLGATMSAGAAAAQTIRDGQDAGTGYVLGPNDQIMIRALDAEEISDKTYRVDPDGNLTLPMIGRLKASGLTSGELESELVSRLERYIRQPKVAVTVMEVHSQPVSVIGAVTTPGTLQLQGKKTLVEVLSMAGGVREDAGQTVTITRREEWGTLPLPNVRRDAKGQFSTAEVRLKAVLEARNPEENITILPNDIVSVARAETIYVLGAVNRAGGIVLKEQDTLSVLQALSLVGGLERTAAPQKAKILRSAPGQTQRTEVPVDLKQVFSGKATDVALQPNDILFVPDSASKRAALRAAEALATFGTAAGTGIILYHP